ncbi:MAG: hypothetical protein SFY80_16870 [Verrucomicrobiota bacterium]|nr:hypothetical protein [Verrucomicrobiota bacterium]
MAYTHYTKRAGLYAIILAMLVLVVGWHKLSAIDSDSSGISDVFEDKYGRVMLPEGDEDNDGLTNLQEFLLGTNPNASDLVSGIIVPSFSPDAINLRWATQAGLRYQLELSDDVVNWASPTGLIVGDGADYNYTVDMATGFRFVTWRLRALSPYDRDADGVDDWEEAELGTNPLSSDSDNDGLSDGDEFINQTSSTTNDTDGDGFSDDAEVLMGSSPTSPGSVPQLAVYAQQSLSVVPAIIYSSPALTVVPATVYGNASPVVTPATVYGNNTVQVVPLSGGSTNNSPIVGQPPVTVKQEVTIP